MNSAAVGFQCPNCVKEGTKGMRTGRLPYGGERTGNPALTSIGLIILNAAVWLAISADGGNNSTLVDKLAIVPQFALRPLVGGGADIIDGVAMGSWWQVVTSAFTHVSPLHIGLNMLALYFLGPSLEAVLGRARFLAVYGVSALTGSAGVMLFSNPNTQTLGASGAIFGLLGALAIIAFKVHGDVRTVLMWLGLNLVLTFSISGISWQGHLGGLAGGALLTAAIVYAPRQRRPVWQWSAVAALLVIAIVLIVVRANALDTTPFFG
jgi:membrane associated rhomboid family serine protease